MRATQLLARSERLLASEVLANARQLKLAQETNVEAPQKGDAVTSTESASRDPFYAQLPSPLRKFFEKYPPSPFRKYSDKPTSTHAEDANPFLPNKHPITNSWHDPKYSLRRQADLYKMAYRFGVTHLLPKLGNGKTFYEEKYLTKTPPAGAMAFKLSKGERIAPIRQKEVDTAIAKADETIAKARGTKFLRKIEKKNNQGKRFV
ncbi:mitochondrial 54S ribosomal protein YmL25 [Sugiyamaella lignohabitans]|uniref:Mitochondrial 54S ribosomal protein YmL25 n=1 Tax=Sugiyamaella lignohabitans TaxID=796027 RepID=A0A161HGC5_9ASCO|nr:mitochondrial 54S ribosomal protein YmL25 [Sugiyamaella lignohabitans]ANB11801.1 mitochondrial 54S ribosomal protein YmL25 [Sugiyamaella lignohabitans]